MAGDEERGKQAFLAAAEALGLLGDKADELKGKADQASQSTGNFTNQMQVYLNYTKGLQEIETKYQQQREELTKTYEERVSTETAQFNANRVQQLSDFWQSEKQTEADYYTGRMEAARDFGVEMERLEEDHQVQMRRLSEDHNSRMESALDRQDAFAVLAEMKSYNRERSRAEEDYQREARSECRLCPQDGGRSGALRSGAGAALRGLPAAAGGPEGAVRGAAAAGEGGVPEAAARPEPAVHRRAHRAAPGDDRPADRPDRRTEPGALPAGAVHECHAGRPAARDCRSKRGGAGPRRRGGSRAGTPGRGCFRCRKTGGREFVLNGDTTQAAENLARGSLDQRSVLAMMAAGASGGGGGVVYNDQRRFDSRIHAEDRQAIMNDTAQALAAAIKRTGRRR